MEEVICAEKNVFKYGDVTVMIEDEVCVLDHAPEVSSVEFTPNIKIKSEPDPEPLESELFLTLAEDPLVKKEMEEGAVIKEEKAVIVSETFDYGFFEESLVKNDFVIKLENLETVEETVLEKDLASEKNEQVKQEDVNISKLPSALDDFIVPTVMFPSEPENLNMLEGVKKSEVPEANLPTTNEMQLPSAPGAYIVPDVITKNKTKNVNLKKLVKKTGVPKAKSPRTNKKQKIAPTPNKQLMESQQPPASPFLPAFPTSNEQLTFTLLVPIEFFGKQTVGQEALLKNMIEDKKRNCQNSRLSINVHKNIETKRFMCQTCGKAFPRNYNLKQHMNRKKKCSKLMACKHCCKVVNTEANLLQDMTCKKH